MTNWHSLFLISNPPVLSSTDAANWFTTTLTGDGYTLYNPFGLIPALSYNDTIKAFVTPVQAGWVRVLSETAFPAHLLQQSPPDTVSLMLALSVGADDATCQFYDAHGQPLTDPTPHLQPYLKPGASPDRLAVALGVNPDETDLPPPEAEPESVGAIPLDALPENLRDKASTVNPKQFDKLFNKMSAGALKGADADAAADLLRQQGANWNTPAARRVRLLMDLLTAPDHWRYPEYVPLRDAYALHARHQRKPNARLYPGDAEAMQAVPDALTYIPVYAGRSA